MFFCYFGGFWQGFPQFQLPAVALLLKMSFPEQVWFVHPWVQGWCVWGLFTPGTQWAAQCLA